MNNDRRKQLATIANPIGDAQGKLGEVAAQVRSIFETACSEAQALLDTTVDQVQASEWQSEVESVKDEEQEAFDNMPEGLQRSEAGERSEESINHMEEASSKLEEIADFFGELDFPALLEEKLTELEGLSDTLGEVHEELQAAQE